MFRNTLFVLLLLPTLVPANPPVASYIFPAGGQRGSKVNVRVGGLFLHNECGFEMLGAGVTAPAKLQRVKTLWFEGPLLPLPDSQRQEDYPKDMAGELVLAPDAAPGMRYWRLWTSQGATPAMKFIVGDLPEVVESEIDGDPVPVKVALPVTINGRIFPRENIDAWSFQAAAGETIRCEVHAARLGSPLDARLEVCDEKGRKIAESEHYYGADPVITFTAPAAGEYQVRIQDMQAQGGQAYVYRLTLTTEPVIERVFPLGGQRGQTLEISAGPFGNPSGKKKVLIPKDAPAEFDIRSLLSLRQINSLLLDVDDLPEVVGPVADRIAPLPAVLNGRIDRQGQIDVWKWQGKKGDMWEFELRAARLGSRLDGVIFIGDGKGKTLARAETNPQDPVLRFQVPADGEYVVGVQDRFRSRAGPDFGYRLRIAELGPADFRLFLAGDAVSLPRKGTVKLKINVQRLSGFKEPIELDARGLPAGVSVTGTTIPGNQASVDLVFKADDTAKIDVSRLSIFGKAKVGEKVLETQAIVQVGRGLPELSSVLLAVTVPTPFVIKGEYDMGFAARGGMHKRKYKIERNGYDGPIEVSMADRQTRHLQGVEGPTIIVPAGESEFVYTVYLPPWMETGRTSRTCVMGVAVIKEPGGTKHRVSYSSVGQNEQLVAVVGPGKLAMSAARTSYTAEPGKIFSVAVRIQRGQDVDGPVELELITPPHLLGLTAKKVTIPAKQDQGQLTIDCAAKLPGPFNMPVVVRATMFQGGERLVAEVKLDVQP
jgi:hypothetical protein